MTLKPDQTPSDALLTELVQQVRRLLRKISAGDVSDMGDTSTLLDADVVNRLIQGAKRK